MKRFFIKSVACISIAFFLAVILPSGFQYPKANAAKTPQENADLLKTGKCDSVGGYTIIGSDCYYAQRDSEALKILMSQAILNNDQTAKDKVSLYGGEALSDQITIQTAQKNLNDLKSQLDKEIDPVKKAQIQSQITQYETGIAKIQTAIDEKTKIGPVNDCGKLDLGCHLNFFFSTILPQALMGMVIKVINIVLWVIVKILAWILGAAAALLDLAMDYTMRIGEKTALIATMKQTWFVLRDTFNVLFIFILLYISIQTILKGAAAKTKQMLANVVIAALLINFSLFLTNTIIDASNIFTIAVYNKSQPSGQSVTLSTSIMKSLSLQTLEKDPLPMDSVGFTMRSFIQIILYSVVIWAFIQAMLLMLVRTIMFFVLMALSPIGFMGDVVPRIGEYSKKWWSTLTDQAIIGPIFMFFMLIIVTLINSGVLKDSLVSAGTMVSGESFGVISGSFLNVFIIIGFIITAVKISKKLSGEAGAFVSGFGGKLAGALTVGAGGMLLRNTIGRGAAALVNNDKFKEKASKTIAGRLALRATDNLSKRSFDVRNTKLGKTLAKQGLDLGKGGGKDGFQGQVKRVGKWTEDTAKLMERDMTDGGRGDVMAKERIAKELEKKTSSDANHQNIVKEGENHQKQFVSLQNAKKSIEEELNKPGLDEGKKKRLEGRKSSLDKMMLEKEKEIKANEANRAKREMELLDQKARDSITNEIKTEHQSTYAGVVKDSTLTWLATGTKGRKEAVKKVRDLVKGKSKSQKLADAAREAQKELDDKESKPKEEPKKEEGGDKGKK
jgi:hypothetical protein